MPDWELIVVDDGSTDGTAEAVKPFLDDERVRYVPRSRQGRSAARNHGAGLARGRWVAFLDSDDWFHPTALADHLAVASEQPEAAMIIGGYQYVDADGRALGERHPWEEGGLGLTDWLFNCLAIPGSALLQRTWWERSSGFDTQVELAEDWDLYLRLAQSGCPMTWCRSMVLSYRQHKGASSQALSSHTESAQFVLDKFYRQPDLPQTIRDLQGPAQAWRQVALAVQALAAGQSELAQTALRQALRSDPLLAGPRKLQLLEALLGAKPAAGATPDRPTADLQSVIPPEMQVTPREIRQARARLAMAPLFRWAGNFSDPAAWPAIGFSEFGCDILRFISGKCGSGERESRLAVDPLQVLRISTRDGQCEQLRHLVRMQFVERELKCVESRRARLQKHDHFLFIGNLALPPVE